MKLLLLISLLTITIEATPRKVVLQEWKNFKDTYGKTYANENEDMARLKTFWNNRRIIQHHNKKFSKGKVGYDVSMNRFGDLFETELASYRGHNNNRGFTRNADRYAELNSTDLPTSIDWREKGAVTPVKDQGNCGSCYAFSAIAALESHHYLATGETIILSEQNAIDCTWQYGNDGCDGGWENKIFEYTRDNGGIDTQESYPYQGIDCAYCRHKPKYKKINCGGTVDVPEGEMMLQSALAHVGPICVTFNCLRSFDFYKSGVYYDPCCTVEDEWHGVLVVGYGTTTDGKDYWIIKNSWGPEWGENGFAKMARNLDNQCFIASWPCYPIVRS